MGIFFLILVVVLMVLLVTNYGGLRDSAYNSAQGTIFAPMHDWVVATWLTIGHNGLTYIAATLLGTAIFGGLFMVFFVYQLIWKTAIQKHLLHKEPTTTGQFTPQKEPKSPERAPTEKTEPAAPTQEAT